MSKKDEKEIFFSSPKKTYFSLAGKFRYDWVQDSFLKSKKGASELSRERFMGHSLTIKKIIFIGGLFWLILFLLFWRIGELQIFNGTEMLLAAEENRFRYYSDPAPRGIIYDINGRALVKNNPSFSLSVSPKDVLVNNNTRSQLQEFASISDEEIEEILSIPNLLEQESVVVKEKLSYEDALKIQVAAVSMPGLYLLETSYREYDLDEHKSLSHVLGYVGKINIQEWDEISQKQKESGNFEYKPTDLVGKQGIEKSYEHLLRGVFGTTQIEVDAKGKHGRELGSVGAKPGDSIVLALDFEVQDQLAKISANWMDGLDKTRAAAVAINPNNGEVVALVSLPSFDNNDFINGIDVESFKNLLENEDQPLFNRAIGGRYPSGSVVKPFIAAAALQEGIINTRTSFLSAGGISVSRWFFKDWKAGGHGITNVKKAIADSVNTFFYIIGGGHDDFEGLGVNKIAAYLQQFGFADITEIDIPGESAGFIPTPDWKQKVKDERWYIGDTYNLSIGQGDFLTSPLQLTVATAAVANGGILYSPRLIHGIANSKLEVEKEFESNILNAQFILPEHLLTIRQGMRQTILSGSAKHLLGAGGLDIAGKTGTAQWSNNKEPHAWFTSFAPYEDPEIVLTILIEEGENGASVAAGIARDFYNWWGWYRNK